MLDSSLDSRWIAQTLEHQGRCQVENFLQQEAAARIHRCLSEDVPWALSLHGDHGHGLLSHAAYARLDEEERAALCRETAEGARGNGFRFVFENYEMIQAYKEKRDPGLLLHRVLEFLNTPDFVAWTRHITGHGDLRRVSAQATRYRPGHFLRLHDDSDSKEGRRFAYVLNLTERWEADWGGLLQFVGHDRQVEEAYLPKWNTLSLFRVPHPHQVSLVSPWAEVDRYAITGWFLV